MTYPMQPLSALGTIQTGSTPLTSEEKYWGGDYPFVTPAELDKNFPITATPRTLSDEGANQSRLLQEGAVMVCCIGSLGKLGIAGRPVVTNQQINSIEFDQQKIWPKFGFYACQRLKPRLLSMAPATTIPIVSKSKFGQLEIPVPPLPEQRRIAAILDQADALRAKRREALTQLDSLAQSIFIEMFGEYHTGKIAWPIKLFEQIAIDTKIGLVRSAAEFGLDFDVPYVRMNAIGRKGEFMPELVQRTNATSAEVEDFKLMPGDLLFNTRNSKELVGKTALFRENGLFVYNNNLMRVRLRDGIEPEYVAAAFLTPYVQHELETRKAGTTSVFAIYARELKSLPIPIPPRPLQQTFATRIKAVEAQKAMHRNGMRWLDNLFASLQHRAFRGEL